YFFFSSRRRHTRYKWSRQALAVEAAVPAAIWKGIAGDTPATTARLAVQDAGQHRHALFRECVREMAPPTLAFRYSNLEYRRFCLLSRELKDKVRWKSVAVAPDSFV